MFLCLNFFVLSDRAGQFWKLNFIPLCTWNCRSLQFQVEQRWCQWSLRVDQGLSTAKLYLTVLNFAIVFFWFRITVCSNSSVFQKIFNSWWSPTSWPSRSCACFVLFRNLWKNVFAWIFTPNMEGSRLKSPLRHHWRRRKFQMGWIPDLEFATIPALTANCTSFECKFWCPHVIVVEYAQHLKILLNVTTRCFNLDQIEGMREESDGRIGIDPWTKAREQLEFVLRNTLWTGGMQISLSQC